VSKHFIFKKELKKLLSMHDRMYISDSYILKAFFHIFLAYKHR